MMLRLRVGFQHLLAFSVSAVSLVDVSESMKQVEQEQHINHNYRQIDETGLRGRKRELGFLGSQPQQLREQAQVGTRGTEEVFRQEVRGQFTPAPPDQQLAPPGHRHHLRRLSSSRMDDHKDLVEPATDAVSTIKALPREGQSLVQEFLRSMGSVHEQHVAKMNDEPTTTGAAGDRSPALQQNDATRTSANYADQVVDEKNEIAAKMPQELEVHAHAVEPDGVQLGHDFYRNLHQESTRKEDAHPETAGGRQLCRQSQKYDNDQLLLARTGNHHDGVDENEAASGRPPRPALCSDRVGAVEMEAATHTGTQERLYNYRSCQHEQENAHDEDGKTMKNATCNYGGSPSPGLAAQAPQQPNSLLSRGGSRGHRVRARTRRDHQPRPAVVGSNPRRDPRLLYHVERKNGRADAAAARLLTPIPRPKAYAPPPSPTEVGTPELATPRGHEQHDPDHLVNVPAARLFVVHRKQGDEVLQQSKPREQSRDPPPAKTALVRKLSSTSTTREQDVAEQSSHDNEGGAVADIVIDEDLARRMRAVRLDHDSSSHRVVEDCLHQNEQLHVPSPKSPSRVQLLAATGTATTTDPPWTPVRNFVGPPVQQQEPSWHHLSAGEKEDVEVLVSRIFAESTDERDEETTEEHESEDEELQAGDHDARPEHQGRTLDQRLVQACVTAVVNSRRDAVASARAPDFNDDISINAMNTNNSSLMMKMQEQELENLLQLSSPASAPACSPPLSSDDDSSSLSSDLVADERKEQTEVHEKLNLKMNSTRSSWNLAALRGKVCTSCSSDSLTTGAGTEEAGSCLLSSGEDESLATTSGSENSNSTAGAPGGQQGAGEGGADYKCTSIGKLREGAEIVVEKKKLRFGHQVEVVEEEDSGAGGQKVKVYWEPIAPCPAEALGA